MSTYFSLLFIGGKFIVLNSVQYRICILALIDHLE